MKLHAFACLLLTMSLSGLAVAEPEASSDESSVKELAEGPMKKMQPFIGTWEINDAWSNGEALWARNEYKVGLGGRFVEATTYAKDGDGEPYERYRTIFSHDAESGEYRSYGFTYDGTATVVTNTIADVDGQTSITSEWEQGPAEIRQTVTTIDADNYRWQVWMRGADSDDWS